MPTLDFHNGKCEGSMSFCEKRLSKKRRLIRILDRASKLRERGQLHYDACDMIYCALIDSDDDNLGNAEWELGLPVLARTDGTIDQSRSDLHRNLAYCREQYTDLICSGAGCR
jgi:hypothetical protein